jgi:hypothetical protein
VSIALRSGCEQIVHVRANYASVLVSLKSMRVGGIAQIAALTPSKVVNARVSTSVTVLEIAEHAEQLLIRYGFPLT